MKTHIATKLSASVLALTIGTGAPAQEGVLEEFAQACEQGADLPGSLTCDLVGQAQEDPSLMGQVMAAAEGEAPEETQQPPAEEPAVPAEAAEPATAAEPAEAGEPVEAAEPAEEAPQEPVEAAEPAEEAPEEPVEAAEPAEDAPEEPVEAAEPAEEAPEEPVEAAEPAEEAPQEPVEAAEPAEDAPEEPVEAAEPAEEAPQEPVEAAEPAEDAPEEPVEAAEPAEEAPEEPVEAAEPAEEAPEEPAQAGDAAAEADAQAQADAVSAQDAAPAAAAAADSEAEAERVEETVEADAVRRSDEDFETSVNEAPAARDDDDDDDDEMDDAERLRRTLGTAAAVGLGAVVLNEILESNDTVVSNSGDRVVVERDGRYRVLRNDDVLLRRPGADVETYRYDDGSTRAVVTYEDGTVVETVRAADGRVLRRLRTLQDGTEVVLFDDTQQAEQVVVNDLPQVDRGNRVTYRESDSDALARALAAQQTRPVERTFSLNQVRNIDQVRYLVPEISVDSVNFQTGSAAIRPAEAEELSALGNAMRDAIRQNPSEVFLIEGHTDAVGDYAFNLALSDRRAESVALALTEYFQVPPENMVLQGYGEGDLLVNTQDAEQANRRVAVRRVTPLLQSSTASRN